MINENEYGSYFKQYEKLIHKIAHQYEGVSNESYDDLYSASCEGFIKALKSYDGQGNFNQWLAFGCRNSVLNAINNYSRTITVPAYGQKQIESGKSEAISTTSLDINFDGEDIYTDHIIAIGVEDSNVQEEDSFARLYKTIEENFDAQSVEILYKKYGLNGRKQTKCADIAAEYGLTGPKVSSTLKKIYTFIANDQTLKDEMIELLNRM